VVPAAGGPGDLPGPREGVEAMGWSWMRKLFEAWYSDVGTVLLMARLKQGRRKDDRPVWALDRAGRR